MSTELKTVAAASIPLPREYYIAKLAGAGILSMTSFREVPVAGLKLMWESFEAALAESRELKRLREDDGA